MNTKDFPDRGNSESTKRRQIARQLALASFCNDRLGSEAALSFAREFRRRHLSVKALFVEIAFGSDGFGQYRIQKDRHSTNQHARGVWRRSAARARLEARQREADEARGRKPGSKRNPKGGRPYKREYGEPDEKAQDNFTDPESRIMKTSTEGFQQCYNAQVAVEGENQLIVATEVSWNANDQGRMVPLVDEVEATHGERPETVLADAGYCNEDDLQALEARGVDGYVALGREGRRAVAVDAAKHPAKARMAEKLATEAGRAQYAQRKWLSEAPNGWIKEVLGFRRFSLRGLNKVRGEWDLVCLALNVKRMQGLQAA